MSYFVLALGGLLALGGALALFTSYGIILVERGWAGVIAGTTALASGVVTIALGLILHRLSSFYKLLKTGKYGVPSPRSLADKETYEPSAALTPHHVPKAVMTPETAPNSAGVPRASGLRSWPQRQARSFHSPGRSFFKRRGAGVPAAPRTGESPPSPSSGNEGAADLPSEPGLGPATPAETAGCGGIGQLPHTAPADEMADEGRRNGRGGGPLPLQDDGGREPLTASPFPETPIGAGEVDVEPWPGRIWPTEPAMIETIFPEAGQMIQQPIAQTGKETGEKPLPELRDDASLEPPPVTFEAATGAHSVEPGSGNEPPSDDAISGDTLAIVGRYESEGASFVRYADGSIEARTDHAVFHFKSMAELKRFMDSQAQTPKE